MADDNDKTGALGTRRFRLPKLFAEAEGAEENPDVGANGELANGAAPEDPYVNYEHYDSGQQAAASYAEGGTTADEILEYVAGMAQELLVLREKVGGVADAVNDLATRESAQEKVFDTLHAELGDYKKDFIYEHLKPVVRPLLFLYDSLEQFDGEVAQYEKFDGPEQRQLSPQLVRQNVAFFRDQLVEALRVCEVVEMDRPEGTFNPKMQKAVGVEKVEADRDNTIVRVVRAGWFLNGQLFRPAEVVVGKAGK